MRLADVARPNCGCQAVIAVVRARDDFFGIGERHRRNHRAEDFFLDDFHILVRVDQDRGLNEISAVTGLVASNDRLRAFREARFEVSADAIQLFFGDQRPHLRFRLKPRSNFNLLRVIGDAFDNTIVDRFLHVEARSSAATLAVIEEDCTRRAGNRGFEIGIFEDDVRRFATEFQGYFFQIAGGGVDD